MRLRRDAGISPATQPLHGADDQVHVHVRVPVAHARILLQPALEVSAKHYGHDGRKVRSEIHIGAHLVPQAGGDGGQAVPPATNGPTELRLHVMVLGLYTHRKLEILASVFMATIEFAFARQSLEGSVESSVRRFPITFEEPSCNQPGEDAAR